MENSGNSTVAIGHQWMILVLVGDLSWILRSECNGPSCGGLELIGESWQEKKKESWTYK